jgi:WD40 repeat protein
MATNWDIYDAFNPAETDNADAVAAPAGKARPVAAPAKEPEVEVEPEPEAQGEAAAEPESESAAEPEPEPEQLPDLAHLDSLPETLKTVERMLTQNLYHDKHLEYRNYRSAQLTAAQAQQQAQSDQTEVDAKPKLEKLWTFSCSATEGRNVSAMSWNKEDKDLVAASYGEFDFSVEQKDGAIALWSLKNPTHPERVYSLPCGVTSIDWSSYFPFLLAVGRYDGNIAIYDVRNEDDEPILQSGNNTEKHHDPVWQVTWIDKGMERGESLVSISTDGKVKEWRIKKGLEHQELMTMKETARPDKDGGGEQKLISHSASGMCFDFSPLDPQQYLAGTESGTIHKCSCSYNESYLQDFTGHEPGMPVYKIRWSPFAPNIFLSCSADWTAKLWKDDNSGSASPSKFLLSFTSSNDYVGDIRWAPSYSTVFGTVTGDGKLDIWDIEREMYGNPRSAVARDPCRDVHFMVSTMGGVRF